MHTVDMGQVLLWESLTPRVAASPTSRVTGRADTGAVELPTDVESVEHFLAKCSPPDDGTCVVAWSNRRQPRGHGRLRPSSGGPRARRRHHRTSLQLDGQRRSRAGGAGDLPPL